MDGNQFNAARQEAAQIAGLLGNQQTADQGIQMLSREFGQHIQDPGFGAVLANEVRIIQQQEMQNRQQPAAVLRESETGQRDQQGRPLESVHVERKDQWGRPAGDIPIAMLPMGLAAREYARFQTQGPLGGAPYYGDQTTTTYPPGYGAPPPPGYAPGYTGYPTSGLAVPTPELILPLPVPSLIIENNPGGRRFAPPPVQYRHKQQ